MKLRLIGHDYKFAVEQIMLSLFPNEKPEYVTESIEANTDLLAVSRLSLTGNRFAQATTVLHVGQERFVAVKRVCKSKLGDSLTKNRLLQRIIKQSFYKAALKFLDTAPPWGCLTGIRPTKVIVDALESGRSDRYAGRLLQREYGVAKAQSETCIHAAKVTIEEKRKIKQGDIALYVGIPFCPSRCAYCSFVSNAVEKSIDFIEPFLKTLEREITVIAELIEELGLSVSVLYIGGGTPTILPPSMLTHLMQLLQNRFELSKLREYTVEAGRADTVDDEKLATISAFGAGRLCINPQSMSERVLEAIGRKHSPADVRNAFALARRYDMAINSDIIAGLPQDSPEEFARTVDILLHEKPENMTIHTLSLKKGSKIMLENTKIPSDVEVAHMLSYASSELSAGNYFPYYLYRQKFTSGGFENIGWALPGYKCMYNVYMMEELCTVIALGGGGVTKLVSGTGRIERVFNAKFPREYIGSEEKIAKKVEDIRNFYKQEIITGGKNELLF